MLVPIPDDIFKYENKTFGNFTTRQVICLGLATLVMVPTFILLYINTKSADLAGVISVLLGAPLIACSIVKRKGVYLDKIIIFKLKWKFKTKHKRKYKMNNLYQDYFKEDNNDKTKNPQET